MRTVDECNAKSEMASVNWEGALKETVVGPPSAHIPQGIHADRRTVDVVLAGGPTLVRAAMAQVLNATGRFRVVGQTADATAFDEALRAGAEPDVLLFDRGVQGWPVTEFAEAVLAASTTARTIVFGIADAQEADACLRAGATGVLAADVTAAQLVAAMETVLRGGLVLVLGAAPDIADHQRRTAGPEAIATLSGRERQILTMLANGQEGPAIAAALRISPFTVKTHIANLLAKIGVRQRGHAIAFAYEHGLVVPSVTPVSAFTSQLPKAS
ncbi:LuxR C-terminal-related transcriptional regulator [Streptomyces sp. NPDC003832]